MKSIFFPFSILFLLFSLIHLPLMSEERLFWMKHEASDKQLMRAKLWEDSEGNLIAYQSFEYTEEGFLMLSTLYGNQSGNETLPLLVDDAGYLIDNGIERYTICWTYEIEDNTLIACRTEDDGTTLYYKYQFKEPIGTEEGIQEKFHSIAKSFYVSIQPFLEWCQSIKKALSYETTIRKACHNLTESIYSKNFLKAYGYYSDISSRGCYHPGCEVNNSVRVTLINGILNNRQDMEENLEKFHSSHGGVSIHYVFRSSEGWTRDLFDCGFVKMGLVSTQASLLADLWKSLIVEMGGPDNGGVIIHYAHSIGASDTWTAKSLLTVEEQKMIHIVTIGSPSMVPSDIGFASAVNYVSKYDGVSILMDPIGCMNGWLSGGHIQLLDSDGIPMFDHTLNSTAYSETIEKLGAQFVKTYGQFNNPR